MSLLDLYYEDFVLLIHTYVDDGVGGYKSTYSDGITIGAAIREDQSMQSLVAQKQGVTSVYTLITPKSLNLQFHDVLRRVKDGQIFRVTSNGDDKTAPDSSALVAFDGRAVTAEAWELPGVI